MLDNNNHVMTYLDENLKEIQKLKDEHLESRERIYFKITILLPILYGLFSYSFKKNLGITLLLSLGCLTIIFLCISIFAFKFLQNEKTDIFSWISNKDMNLIKQKEKALIEYIKAPNVQLEIFKFAEKKAYMLDLFELKKSFALNQYKVAFNILSEFFNELNSVYKRYEAMQKEEELVKNYEDSLKMKI